LASRLSPGAAPSGVHRALATQPVGGDVLTLPGVPASNGGQDNAEGNLIVAVGDALAPSPPGDHVYRVCRLLGQGTFAQVFECTREGHPGRCAVKVVKNRPAYARQAAVEIDVFRAMAADPTFRCEGTIGLRHYFRHANHLCLVFELLGGNLYEVLRKRQFRGLPLDTVRSIVGQLTRAVAELAKKSIVHCDLKPENILVAEKESERAMDALDGGTTPRHPPSKTPPAPPPAPPPPPPATDDASFVPESQDTFSSGRTSRDATSSSASPGSDAGAAPTPAPPNPPVRIKIIDFGSACFTGRAAHAYVQSRFYRSPEVLVGLPYDSAVDMWSLGCVAAELYLGLPILPGVHEHDQLCRIQEMVAPLPDWMVEEGTKSELYYCRADPTAEPPPPLRPATADPDLLPDRASVRTPNAAPGSAWALRTGRDYAATRDGQRKGAVADYNKNRYFRQKRLADIVARHGGRAATATEADRVALRHFVHFLTGLLEPDPWRRWTAYQAISHPFLMGGTFRVATPADAHGAVEALAHGRGPDDPGAWSPRWDASICHRRLLHVERSREMQSRRGRGAAGTGCAASPERRTLVRGKAISPEFSSAEGVTAMTDAMSLSQSSHKSMSRSPATQHPPPQQQHPPQQQQQHPQQQQAPPPHVGMAPAHYETWVRRSPAAVPQGALRRVPSLTSTMPGNWAEPQYGAAIMTPAMQVGGFNYSFTPALSRSMPYADRQPCYEGAGGLPGPRGDFGHALRRPGAPHGDAGGSPGSLGAYAHLPEESSTGAGSGGVPQAPPQQPQQSASFQPQIGANQDGRPGGSGGTPARYGRRKKGGFALAGQLYGSAGDASQPPAGRAGDAPAPRSTARSLLAQQLEDPPPPQHLHHPQTPSHHGSRRASEPDLHHQQTPSHHGSRRASEPDQHYPSASPHHHHTPRHHPHPPTGGGYHHHQVFRQGSVPGYELSPSYIVGGSPSYHTPLGGAPALLPAAPVDPRSLPHLYGSYGGVQMAPGRPHHYLVPAGPGQTQQILAVVGAPGRGGPGGEAHGNGLGGSTHPVPHGSPRNLRPNYGTSM